uniref:Uncharacterized protein K02A2.6-like n=1 Tax=Phallusia mammillata TaxID=59560 RepID=A0A6F9D6F5_9ASCI|nr:uncharacterized protein K02A2.6-like [Phallusia mammillata]
MGRRLRELSPMTSRHLEPRTVPVSVAQQYMRERRNQQKKYFDRGARPLPPLQTGDKIYHRRDKNLEPATVIKASHKHRSYIIKDKKDDLLRRNRRFLYKARFEPIIPHTEDVERNDDARSASLEGSTYHTRSGRTIHAPQRFSE